jgi:hypothetical protein
MKFDYILDESYSALLIKLVDFIDGNNAWDIFAKLDFSLPDAANDLFVKVGLDSLTLSDEIKSQILSDIKFMCQYDTDEVRNTEFKKYYCSTRLFNFMNDTNSIRMCQTAYNTIVDLDEWEYFKKFSPNSSEGFMWTQDEKMNSIMNRIAEVDSSHSGCSIAFTMRKLEWIAKLQVV